jgi:hypothetical protein
MSPDLLLAITAALGTIAGGAIVAMINAVANRKNTLTSALHNAAQTLDITTAELVESMIVSKQLRDEKNILEREYVLLKNITRKIYQRVKEFDVAVGLTDEELKQLFDTQPLALLAEQQRRERERRAVLSSGKAKSRE